MYEMIPLTYKLTNKKWGIFRRSRMLMKKWQTLTIPTNPMKMGITNSVWLAITVLGVTTLELKPLKLDWFIVTILSGLVRYSSVVEYSWHPLFSVCMIQCFGCRLYMLCTGHILSFACSFTTFFKRKIGVLLNLNPQNLSLTYGPY